jgi:hypothetical protein
MIDAEGKNDVYVAWWTNKTGNDEVMYRVSIDGGKTFTDKINLSNTPAALAQLKKKGPNCLLLLALARVGGP